MKQTKDQSMLRLWAEDTITHSFWLTAPSTGCLQKEQKELDDLESEFQSLQQQQESELQALKDRWAKVVNDIHEISLPPARKDLFVERFGIAWQPYVVFKTVEGKLVEAPGCAAE